MRRSWLKRRNKFGAIKTRVGNTVYDSKFEAEICQIRRLEARAGIIDNYEEQKEFELTIYDGDGNKRCIGTYRCDCFFRVVAKDLWVIEDIKGVETDVFKLKKKLIEFLYPQFEFWVTKRDKSGTGYRTSGQSYAW